jgi:hypothetical protein
MQNPSPESAGTAPGAAPAAAASAAATASPATAASPTTPATSPAENGFVHVEGNTTEQVSETGSLFVAYSIIWVILVAFAVTHFRALRGARELTSRLERVVPEPARGEEEA